MATASPKLDRSTKSRPDNKMGRSRLEPVEGDEGLFGQHLANLVAQAGLSSSEFADKIGKTADTVTLYFSGRRLPKMRDYRVIAKALGLASIRELLPDLPTGARKKPKRAG